MLVWAAQENSIVAMNSMVQHVVVVMADVDRRTVVIVHHVCCLMFRNVVCPEDGLLIVMVHQLDAADRDQLHSTVVEELCHMIVLLTDIVDLLMDHNVQHVKDLTSNEIIDTVKCGLVSNNRDRYFLYKNILKVIRFVKPIMKFHKSFVIVHN